jgi:hypothetical protein
MYILPSQALHFRYHRQLRLLLSLKRSYVCIRRSKTKNIVSDIFSPKIDCRYISVKIICSKTTSESIMIKGVGVKSLCLLLSAYPMLLTGNLL